MNKIKLLLFCLIGIIISCSKFDSSIPTDTERMDTPLSGLTYEQNRLFQLGSDEFEEIYTSENGLGPMYVANSCGSCHPGDNRGQMANILTRFGQSDSTGNKFLDFGGPQLQNFSNPGYQYEVIPEGSPFTRFIAPIVSGVGLLDLVSDEAIIAMANENQSNQDGVRGRPHWNSIPSFETPRVNAISVNNKYICRFGRKGAAYNLHQQTVQALHEDMGITSSYLSSDLIHYSAGIPSTATFNPEISDNSISHLVFYLQTLQAPTQRQTDDATVIYGKKIFENIGCEVCHRSHLTTGYSSIEALSYKTFSPYTDLLLHDMGPMLDDGYTEGTAKSSEWKTTPLWGLGLASRAQGGSVFLMHDGRAKSVEEAILIHGGESSSSVLRYQQLNTNDKAALLKFLNSL